MGQLGLWEGETAIIGSRAARSCRVARSRDALSRFTEVRQNLEDIEACQRTVIEQTGNSLAASLGELEDKVERALGQATRG